MSLSNGIFILLLDKALNFFFSCNGEEKTGVLSIVLFHQEGLYSSA